MQLVPDFILEKNKNNQPQGTFSAIVMLLDISGFTGMTYQLIQSGKEGAEILSRIINDIFSPCIEAIYQNGGFVSGFAGDSLTAVFETKTADFPLSSAFSIIEIFTKKGFFSTKFGDFKLDIKIGFSAGQIEYEILTGKTYNTYYFKGKTIKNSVQAERKAARMEIIGDDCFIRLCNTAIMKEKIDENRFRILPQKWSLPKLDFGKKNQKAPNLQNLFVPNSILEMKSKGELREIVSCFIGFEENEGFQKAILQVMNSCILYGGYLNKIDFGDKGGIILVLFGAPKSEEKLYQRAADFALSLNRIEDFHYRVGLTAGIAYTGFIGSAHRQEYTALGSVVNLSARYMLKANNRQIIAEKQIADYLKLQYEFIPADVTEVKGFQQPVEAFILKAKSKKQVAVSYQGSFIGRDSEMKRCKELISPIFHHQFGGLVYLDGDAGIGKSCFINQLSREISCPFFFLPCDEILRKSFNPFEHFFKWFFDQSEWKNTEQNKLSFKLKFDHFIKKIDNQSIKKELIRTESLIGALIGLEWENSLYSKLDAKGRFDNTQQAIIAFFFAQSLLSSLVLVLEDAHWIDNESKHLLKQLVQNAGSHPFIILVSCRFNDNGTLFSLFSNHAIKTDRMELKAFDQPKMRELLREKLKTNYIPEQTEEFFWRKSGGNPFFIEQLVFYLTENQLLDNDLNLAKQAQMIPSEISQIIVSRIDRLSVKMKEIVKTASILGREFALQVLQKLLVEVEIASDANEFNLYLQEGENEQIWELFSEMKYIFKHALIRDAVYEIQLKESLRILHNLAGNVIENLYEHNLKEHYEELAEHFDKAENNEKAVLYLEKAGDLARDNYQNNKALDFYERTLKKNHADAEWEAEIRLKQKIGSLLELLGKWDEALSLFKEALDSAERKQNQISIADCLNVYGNLLRKKGRTEEAKELMEKSLGLSEKLNFKDGISNVSGNLGVLYWSMGNLSTSLEYFQRSLKICEEANDWKGIAKAIGNIAGVYYVQGKHTEALQNCHVMQQICEENNYLIGIQSVTGNMGLIYSEQGNTEKAMECYHKKLEICKKLGDKNQIALAYSSIGIIYDEKGNFSEAISFFQKSLTIYEELGEIRSIGIVMGNIGSAYSRIGRHREGLDYFHKQLHFRQQVGDKKGICLAMANLSNANFFLSHFTEALSYIDEAIILAQELKLKKLICEYSYEKANILLHLNRIAETNTFIQKTLQLAEEINLPIITEKALKLHKKVEEMVSE